MDTWSVKADAKGRVTIRGARKRAKYLVTAKNGGWWVTPAQKFTVPKKRDSIIRAWELQAEMLESFYDNPKTW
jgi:hypothetical protein